MGGAGGGAGTTRAQDPRGSRRAPVGTICYGGSAGAPRAQSTDGTPSQSALPLQAGPGILRAGPGRRQAAEPGRLQGGRALTRDWRARARRGPNGERAGALLRAQQGGSGESHSEEPAARAARHRHPWPRLGPQSSGGLARDRARTRAAQGRAANSRPLPRGGARPPPPAPPTRRELGRPRRRAPPAAGPQVLQLRPLAFSAAAWGAHHGPFTPGASQAVAPGLGRGQEVMLRHQGVL